MIRSIFIVTASFIVTVILTCAAVIVNIFYPYGAVIRRIAHIWARILLFLSRIKVEVIGTENVLPGRPQIFMANHQGDFDILMFLALMPVDFLWTVKEELFRVPVFGRALRKAGYIEIDRHNHERAMQGLKKMGEELEKGISVVTFPEGTRSRDGKVLPFKQGMFYLAIQKGVPVLPVTIIGSNRIMPKGSLKISRGKIVLVIDKPIETSNWALENRGELIEEVRNIIVANLEKYQ